MASAKEVSLSDRAIAVVQAVYLGDLADVSYEAAKPLKEGSVLFVDQA